MDAINQACDQEGCDTILYALFTWDSHVAGALVHSRLFDGLLNVRRIILETCVGLDGRPWESHSEKAVEVWRRSETQPMCVKQSFARGRENAGKDKFVQELASRVIDDGLLMICGESNIVTLRGNQRDQADDERHFQRRLEEIGTRVILNPIHDYMRRHEMKKKRRWYSRGGRTIVSVWNMGNKGNVTASGKSGDPPLPWTAFHNGEDRTCAVRDISLHNCRRDVRVGVLDVDKL